MAALTASAAEAAALDLETENWNSALATGEGACGAVSAVKSHAAKPQWAVYFAKALPHSEDASLQRTPPAFAAVGASAKPLWLSLEHCDGSRTRASLDTFEDLDDKFVLACAIEKAGLQRLAPPTLALEYDAPRADVLRRIAANPPATLASANDGGAPVWVLKWAQGFGGQDIHFVRSAEAAADIITRNFDDLEAMPPPPDDDDEVAGQPGWVLQAMVPSALVDGRKMHLRSYVVALARAGGPAFYVYDRTEVRLAASEMNDDLTDAGAHLTTGVWRRGGLRDDRTTLDAVRELDGVVGADAVRTFLDSLFRGLPFSAGVRGGGEGRAFGITGVDLMVTPGGELYVLELNASPAAAPEATITAEHKAHLVTFAKRLVALLASDDSDTCPGFSRIGARDA
ncbi:hypothetical protein M885DRAFT_513089 [Pelagophyceae sp. CCMP2097]|nr:hypothetical protein M885DRAFT_513089 [Pelagophyceae sp. CCMP2097]